MKDAERSTSPGEVEVSSSFSKHLGPRFTGAGLRVQFLYIGEPGIHFKTGVSEEYRNAILRGISEAMKERFPRFPPTGSIWVIEQAYFLTQWSGKAVDLLKSPT